MNVASSTKSHIKERAVEEFRRFLTFFIYLAVLIGGFTAYRRLVLAEYHIHYLGYSFAIVEALILAKVLLIGEAINLGENWRSRPLIVVALYKAVLFSLFVMAFAVLEHVISGWVEGRNLAAIDASLHREGKNEILARVVVMFVSFIPLFIILELGRVMGENKLHRLLWRRRTSADSVSGGETPVQW